MNSDARIKVHGSTSGWISSGVCFRRGDSISIVVKGAVKHSSWDGRYHGPDGNPNSFCGNPCKPFTNGCDVAALVAKIGDGAIHCVGNSVSGTVRGVGELEFGIDDSPTIDNRGGFEITIRGGRPCDAMTGGGSW